ncbi:DUF4421 domain-containing protein [Echinicola salinicaeni]|uniref:DUF4421 domain-containing protein n=1 Tax=Echinicola salinicaeni TaxID=2762757 RepID=UPI001E501B2F|nr:DUF4421 domain-containing protein [Echinicola salinicaeni]
MIRKRVLNLTIFVLAFQFIGSQAHGQSIIEDDSNAYFSKFPELITGRVYASRKFSGVKIHDKLDQVPYLNYWPNTSLNLGVGVGYDALNLNLAYGFGFLNPDRGKGETNYLDAQFHTNPNGWVVDGYLQFYKGFHLIPEGTFAANDRSFYYRPDMVFREIGASVQYILNKDKFSYKAAFYQTEWQKKSAGSLLMGFEMYGGSVRGDSSLIPQSELVSVQRDFSKTSFFELGPNIGYAYTLVIAKHFFIMGYASVSPSFGFTQMRGEMSSIGWSLNPNYLLKGSVGYNTKRWAINANFMYENVRLAKVKDFNTEFFVGNVRANFIYRFVAGPKTKSLLKSIKPVW